MAGKAITATILTILLAVTSVKSDDNSLIPADKSQINSWFQNNVKHYSTRTGTLDPELVAAESGVKVIKVRKDGTGDFKTVTAALQSIPSGNMKRVIVWIGGGVYNEKIKIERTKRFVTFYGSPNSMPTLSYAGTAAQYGTVDSATVIAEGDYFVAANIIFTNSAPKPDGKRKGAQAVALRISGDKSAFYNCRITGFQDTVCDDRGRHFFKDCYIEGTVDFIFGSGKSLYLNTELRDVGKDEFSVITAQAKQSDSEDSGYSFVHCTVTGSGSNTYLGRAWMPKATVVYAYTQMGSVVKPEGWSDDYHQERDRTVYYGEYKCMGPGANPGARARFTKQLADGEAKRFISLGYIQGSKWLLPPPRV